MSVGHFFVQIYGIRPQMAVLKTCNKYGFLAFTATWEADIQRMKARYRKFLWVGCFGKPKKAGLLTDPQRVDVILGRSGKGYVAPYLNGPIHNSLTARWWPAEFVLKRHYDWRLKEEKHRMNLFKGRTISSGAFVHAAAREKRRRLFGDFPKGCRIR